MFKIGKQIYNSFFSPKIKSGDEVECIYVEKDKEYQFSSYDRSAMFVLPPKPIIGDVIYFNDGLGSTLYHNVKIHRNGNLIMGDKEHMTCDVPNINFKLTFVGGYVGWKVESDIRFVNKRIV